ncbi:MAG: TIGR04279 domain-containing protein [Methanosarcina sp.]|uniref:TIGR04279 domain-containing protein n=1 Tax=Methanosarcina sp. TaxID=2213 RepID=UPI00260B88F8|nr:TIGR04279 domain-containing protein [Methanosarcina sp.]MDD3246266.1 TIGR04279 domain-containing protein [Methanosarcina sp.]
MKKKSGMCKGISGRKWRVTWILLILVFSIISVSATGADNSTKSHASDVVDISEQNINASNVVDVTYQNTNSSDVVDDPEQHTNSSDVVDDPNQKTDSSDVVDDSKQHTNSSDVVDDPEQNTNSGAVVDDPEQNTNSSDVVDDPEQNTNSSDVVDDPEQNTNSGAVVDDPEQNTDASNGADDQKPNTNSSDVVDDPEQNTDASNVVDDPEQNTNSSDVVDDPEQNTDASTGADDQKPNTNSSDVVDDQNQNTNSSSRVDDQKPNTDASNVVDDPEQKTDASNVVDDPEQNTNSSDVVDDQKPNTDANSGVDSKQKTDACTCVDDPEQKTDVCTCVDDQGQKTDASPGVNCPESSKVNSEQKTDVSNEISIGAKTESKTETYNGTKSLENGEANPEIKVYNWNDSAGNESVIPEIKSEGSSWNNLKLIQSYPYSLRSFYTVNESVKIIYRGPETLGQQKIDIYLVKEKSSNFPENAISNGINESTIPLEDVFNNNTESYIQIPATLNKYGDLSPLTVGPLPAGSYWVLITLAGNETKKPESEKEILLANYFEVLKYELVAGVPYTLEEGESFEVNLNLKNAPALKNYTYWAVLIREDAYTTSEGTNPGSMNSGIRPIVNGIDIIRSLETSLIKSESETGKGELESNIQALIGKGNGMISIGEKNQSTLSLKSFELPPGDYLLLAGAYENDEGLAGINQKKLRISAENSYGSGLKASSENQIFGNISPRKYTVSSLLGINPPLETPEVFISKDIKPYIQARASVEVVRNPLKIPSFLLGFTGTLIGLAILRKYR